MSTNTGGRGSENEGQLYHNNVLMHVVELLPTLLDGVMLG